MTPIPSARCERKLIAAGLSLAEVLALVRRHPAGFRQAYPERRVNNIYLDSPSLDGFHEHVNGSPHREKFRVRWYGQFPGPVAKPVLERKIKRGAVSGKIAQSLPPLALNGEPLRESLAGVLAEPCVPDSLRAAVCHLEPSLLNRYRRHYFVSADGRFRLTVDFELEFARLGRNGGAPRRLLSAGSLVVVEVKYSPREADGVARITNAFPFRVRRCSKYVLGIQGSV